MTIQVGFTSSFFSLSELQITDTTIFNTLAEFVLWKKRNFHSFKFKSRFKPQTATSGDCNNFMLIKDRSNYTVSLTQLFTGRR